MAVDYGRDDARSLITVTIHGAATTQELVATIDRQAEEGTWPYATIVDARDAAPTRPGDVQAIRYAVERWRGRLGARGPAALVVAEDSDAAYGMGRMYELSSGDPAFAVFRDLQEAEHWLAAQNRRSAT